MPGTQLHLSLLSSINSAVARGGGALIGAIFSNVARGSGFGLAGSGAYIMVRKGNELELPVQTAMLIRMHNAITVPVTGAVNAGYSVLR
jgi:hypothetical protein